MLTSAEFAKLCHTSKDTLFFYDKLGLLKPAFVNKKRYRHYEVRQAFTFVFITQLCAMGFTLKEIKQSLADKNENDFVDSLEERAQNFRENIINAQMQLSYIEHIIDLTKEKHRATPNSIIFSEEQDRKFKLIELNETKVISDDDSYIEFFLKAPELAWRKNSSRILLPWSYQLSAQKAKEGIPMFKGFIPISYRGSPWKSVVLPSGTYASWFFSGNSVDHLKNTQSQLNQLSRDYFLDKELYSFDQMAENFMMEGKNFTAKYEIRVTEKSDKSF